VTECDDGSICCGNGDSSKRCCKEGTGSFIVGGKVISALPSKSTDAPATPKSSGKPGASEDDDDDDDDDESSPSSSTSNEDADSDSNNDSSDSTSRPKSKPDSDAESSTSESSSENGPPSGGSSSGSDSGSPKAGSGSTNVGAIAGGVVGGVAGLALIGLAFILFRRKQRASENGILMSDDPYKKVVEVDGAEVPVEIYTPAPVYELQGSSHGR
jgi:hypothetical protein